jgi:hypothetical protein
MPLIEAAHVGAVPLRAFKQVLHVSKESGAVKPLEQVNSKRDQ